MARILLSSQKIHNLSNRELQKRFPEGKVIVHPECEAEVVNAADSNGSTQFIKNYVESMPEGSKVGIGTEINMVARLAQEHPDKHIECLDSQVCPCSNVYDSPILSDGRIGEIS